jgi:hypothetical protein
VAQGAVGQLGREAAIALVEAGLGQLAGQGQGRPGAADVDPTDHPARHLARGAHVTAATVKTVTDRQPPSVGQVARGQAPAPGELELADDHDAVGARQVGAGVVDRHHRARRRADRPWHGAGAEQLDLLVAAGRDRPRPGIDAADVGRDHRARPREVDRAVALVEHAGVAGAVGRLRPGRDGARRELGDRVDQGGGAQRRQSREQLAGGLGRADRRRPGQEDRAGVHADVELHDGHASLGATVEDRPLDRRSAAVGRQERAVDVDAAARERVEDGGRQDLAVGHDHAELGAGGRQRGRDVRVPDRARLQDRQAVSLGAALDRRRGHRPAPPGRLVGLGHDQRDLVAGRQHRLEARHREVRRAHEHQPHAASPGSRR